MMATQFAITSKIWKKNLRQFCQSFTVVKNILLSFICNNLNCVPTLRITFTHPFFYSFVLTSLRVITGHYGSHLSKMMTLLHSMLTQSPASCRMALPKKMLLDRTFHIEQQHVNSLALVMYRVTSMVTAC